MPHSHGTSWREVHLIPRIAGSSRTVQRVDPRRPVVRGAHHHQAPSRIAGLRVKGPLQGACTRHQTASRSDEHAFEVTIEAIGNGVHVVGDLDEAGRS